MERGHNRSLSLVEKKLQYGRSGILMIST